MVKCLFGKVLGSLDESLKSFTFKASFARKEQLSVSNRDTPSMELAQSRLKVIGHKCTATLQCHFRTLFS
jgi:hypothetical protein